VKFKTDENLPVEFCELLRTAGHDAESVFEEKLVGEPDEKIIDVCRDEGRCLITLDLDFSDMRIYPPKELNGLVFMRLRSQEKSNILNVAKKLSPGTCHQ
jgi:predicted nuclease of predicted toxin-antitoxin system